MCNPDTTLLKCNPDTTLLKHFLLQNSEAKDESKAEDAEDEGSGLANSKGQNATAEAARYPTRG